MLDLDPYGGTDPFGMFPLFLKRTAEVVGPRLSVVFRRLVRLWSFPACWRQANVTPIPKGPPSSSVAYYRQISITSALSKVFEPVRLGRFMERSGVHPTTQFALGKVRVPVMHFCACPIHCKVQCTVWCMYKVQYCVDSGQQARIVQIDFSAAFDGVRVFSIGSALLVLGILCCIF